MLSPWLDWLVEPRDAVYDRLAAQPHRRFIKTHTRWTGCHSTPGALRGGGAAPVGHGGLLYHQVGNLDRVRLAQLTGQPARPGRPRAPNGGAVAAELDRPGDGSARRAGFAARVLLHLSDAWARRHEPNVELVHYDDLLADLGGEMRRLADRWGITVPAERWPELVEATTFGRMRERADRLAPDALGCCGTGRRSSVGEARGRAAICWTRPAEPVTRRGRSPWPRPIC
ncbi:sulfotransferase domain-containing protein [Micromonospora sp. M12]